MLCEHEEFITLFVTGSGYKVLVIAYAVFVPYMLCGSNAPLGLMVHSIPYTITTQERQKKRCIQSENWYKNPMQTV